MSNAQALLDRFSASQNPAAYRNEHWQGTFAEYLDLLAANPKVTRTAYQRVYDMILADGSYPIEGTKDLVRFRFFDDPHHGGQDAIFGLTRPLMELVNAVKLASRRGFEPRLPP